MSGCKGYLSAAAADPQAEAQIIAWKVLGARPVGHSHPVDSAPVALDKETLACRLHKPPVPYRVPTPPYPPFTTTPSLE